MVAALSREINISQIVTRISLKSFAANPVRIASRSRFKKNPELSEIQDPIASNPIASNPRSRDSRCEQKHDRKHRPPAIVNVRVQKLAYLIASRSKNRKQKKSEATERDLNSLLFSVKGHQEKGLFYPTFG